ncbi:MAG: hypothetical protein U5L96_12645 [Owenweeksia sp.]|nr:hypothetical protein [Owenweeksia sp.]
MTHAQPDFTHLSLFIKPDTQKAAIDGAVYLKYTQSETIDSLWLDGIRMEYHTVQLNGEEVAYEFNDKGIWLQPDTAITRDTNQIFISYTATPRKGIYFIGWQDTTGLSKRQIWTQGQGIDHRHWIPHNDDQTDKVLVDINVTFDADYEVVANGRLVQKKKLDDGTQEWLYHMEKPMSSYLIAVAIGRYKKLSTQSAAGTPLEQYFYADRFRDYKSYYYKNEEIHNFLQDEIGCAFSMAKL